MCKDHPRSQHILGVNQCISLLMFLSQTVAQVDNHDHGCNALAKS